MLRIGGLEIQQDAESLNDSTYFSFPDAPHMGKIRVADHKELKKYGYRWQIRVDFKDKMVNDAKGHRRFYYPANLLHEAVNHMLNYHRACLRRIEREKVGTRAVPEGDEARDRPTD